MKKQFIILFTLLSTSLIVNAQKEFRLAKTSGQLKLNINGAIIEGYDGKEIIFSTKNANTEKVDERAKGLVPISGSGYTDNTGLGINVKENGQDINVNTVSKNSSDIITIKVPQSIKVSFNNNSNQYYEDIIIKNIKSEIEISTYFNNIKLENNSGPMNIKSINGSVEAIFNTDVKGPISIISVQEYVDITLPASAKANIELETNYGKLYAGKEFNIDVDKKDVDNNNNINSTTTNLTGAKVLTINRTGKQTNNNINITTTTGGGTVTMGYAYAIGEKIKGKLNGGGIDLIFKSNNNNVYLRQK